MYQPPDKCDGKTVHPATITFTNSDFIEHRQHRVDSTDSLDMHYGNIIIESNAAINKSTTPCSLKS